MDNKYTGYEIAIIGMAGQFPGAEDLQAFWENLKNGVESISHFTREELLEEEIDTTLIDRPDYVRANAYLKSKGQFDAAFFDYRPDEANMMDPQMRVLHQCVWAAIEDAGYNINNYKGRVALFAGATSDVNWQNYSTLTNNRFLSDQYFSEFLTNVQYTSSKISYQFNLRGPSVFLNTACSTSLVAVHQACNSLLLGECSMALAGGVSIRNFSKRGYIHREGMILSADGHCRAFDAEASGTVGGEGVGIVVLKRLKSALEDKDNILAVIKGTGINNDGAGKVGYTAPGIDGQVGAIVMATKMARVPLETITYLETHGTGTRLGDPVEVEALNNVFGKSDEKYCAIGSVKTNIGHLDVAAGVAGLIKVVLSLQHKQLPPSLHFKTPNPQINFNNGPFYVNTVLKEWSNEAGPLRAGISSFGIGGTNVHMVIEEAPVAAPAQAEKSRFCLLPFSAKSPSALEGNIRKLGQFLATNKDTSLTDTAYTLQTGRAAFRYRKMLVCKDIPEAVGLLDGIKTEPLTDTTAADLKSPVAFMFPGQGAQYRDMCRDLYEDEPIFRAEVMRCLEICSSELEKDLHHILFSCPDDSTVSDIDDTQYTQPALFVIEYALARLIMSWGIVPDLMIGHSLGEYVAACIGGVFSLAEALKLVIRRGQLMQQMDRGAMLGISLSEADLKPFLRSHKGISLAAVNSSELCVVSGPEQAISEFATCMKEEGHPVRSIRTSHAFHSSMMDEMLEEFENEVRKITLRPSTIPIISNLSGRVLKDKEITDAAYWSKHLRNTVQFSRGLDTLLKEKNMICIEVGPGKVLSTFVRSHIGKKKGHKVINLVRTPQEAVNDVSYLLQAVGESWLHGIELNWEALNPDNNCRKISLPAYSFDKTEHLANVDVFKVLSGMMQKSYVQKKQDIARWFYTPTWKLLPLPAVNTAHRSSGCTLIFADSCGISHRLIKKIKEDKGEVVYVRMADSYQEESSHLYELNPNDEEGYRQLFSSLSDYGLLPHRIIYCWGITRKQVNEFSIPAGNIFFFGLLEIARQYHAQRGIDRKKIIVLTSDLHPVLGSNKTSGVKSMSLGLLRIIAQEFPFIETGHIDICMEEMNVAYVQQLYQEVCTGNTGKVISLRQGQRWEQIYEPVMAEPEMPGRGFREEGVYLITGGLGNLGVTISGYLLRNLRAKVILLGRTEIPPAELWEGILHDDGFNAEIRKKVKQLQALQQEGGEVLYLSCDVADAVAMRNAVTRAEKRFGPVNGVIHAAGLVGGNAVQSLTELQRNDFYEQFLPKITGLQVLRELMESRNPDFCIIISSLAAVLGGLGFGAYAPANIFMDYYIDAYRRKGRLLNWVCVDLDGLNFDGTTTNVIDSSELWEALNIVLKLKEMSRIAVSATDLQERLKKWVYRQEVATEPEIVTTETYTAPATTLEEKLTGIWSTVLSIEKEKISTTSSFFELGGNSLIAPVLLSELNEAFGITVPLKYLYQYPTIEMLSAYLSEKQQIVIG